MAEEVMFTTTILSTGKTTTGIIVPPDLVEALGGGRKPKVAVRLNDYAYRSSIAFMGGDFWLGISAEHREGSGLMTGDSVTVRLSLDTAPRAVAVPEDLFVALKANPKARAAFELLSYSNKRRHVLAVEGAKTAETRQKRIEKVVAELGE